MFAGPTLRLFTIRGIPIGAHWSLLIAAGLMGVVHGGPAGVLLSVLVFGSILLHELGHAVVAQRRRVPIEGIDLHLFGGVAKMAAPPRSPRDEMAIAIAGPLVSLALAVGLGAGAFWLSAEAPGWLRWIAGVNLILGVFNLLPALPMDGGRVLRAALARRHGLVGGTQRAVWVSRGIALLLAGLGAFTDPWLVVMAALLWWMGGVERAQMRRHEALHRLGFRDEAIDPWARYRRAASRGRPLEPAAVREGHRARPGPTHPADVLATMTGQSQAAPAVDRGSVVTTQRLVHDPFRGWVVQTETTYTR